MSSSPKAILDEVEKVCLENHCWKEVEAYPQRNHIDTCYFELSALYLAMVD
jgi:hypothetical protein